MARYLAVLAVKVDVAQTMPLSVMLVAPNVTVAVNPEEQVVPVTEPFAQ